MSHERLRSHLVLAVVDFVSNPSLTSARMKSLLIMTVVLAAASNPAIEYGTVRQAMRDAFARADYPTADAHAARILELRPNFPQALYNRAVLAAVQGDSESAIHWLQRVADVGATYDVMALEPFSALRDDRQFTSVAERLSRNAAPFQTSSVAYSLSQADFIPEGVAYDPRQRRLFVGSVRHRGILSVDAAGREAWFVEPVAHGLGSVMGMRADPARNRLWVASSSTPQMRPPSETEFTGVWEYRLDNGEFVARHMLPAAERGQIGDVIVSHGGRIFASDSRNGAVYELDREGGGYKTLVDPGVMRSAQGMALSAGDEVLYVADYSTGLHAVEIATADLTRMRLADGVHDYGVDGLYRWGDSLVAIQNLVAPHRVVSFTLGNDGRSITGSRVLDAGLPEYSEPTLGVLVGDMLLYVANSQWNRFDRENELPPREELHAPVILGLPLDQKPAEDASPESISRP